MKLSKKVALSLSTLLFAELFSSQTLAEPSGRVLVYCGLKM